MPNPVRAARKAGRSLVKDTKQTIKADKITERYQAKADKIGMKSRAAISAAKAKSEAKAGVTPSTVSKIEPLKKNLQIPTTPLKFELAKPSASAIAAKEAAFKPTPKPAPKKKATPKKSSGASKEGSVGPYAGGYRMPKESATGPYKSDYKFPEEGPVLGTGITLKGKGKVTTKPTAPKSTDKYEAGSVAALKSLNERRAKIGLPPLGRDYKPLKTKGMGGKMKSSYMSGGSVKSKKK